MSDMIELSNKFMRDLCAMERDGQVTVEQIASRLFVVFASFLSAIENPDNRVCLVKEAADKLPTLVADMTFNTYAKVHLAPYVESPRIQ
jgi:hypothetical protein